MTTSGYIDRISRPGWNSGWLIDEEVLQTEVEDAVAEFIYWSELGPGYFAAGHTCMRALLRSEFGLAIVRFFVVHRDDVSRSRALLLVSEAYAAMVEARGRYDWRSDP